MTKILLTCDSDDFDIALDLKFTIQEELGFKVILDVENWKEVENNTHKNNDGLRVSQQLKSADHLLVFEFDESNISAWVMIEDTDEIHQHDKYEPEDYFPECIDFSDSFTKGMRVFKSILRSDFGLVATQ
eukprot:CAMPEP_0113658198 /NCGR_PEP_ID=MMETSP0017_2-20120614/31553_1 /TAXON_ID=2856 /ORGANISM="Cylindrotheca closterium" /LENGTH=129 /DNA_ID=CAMNT_0000572379 /DNA_START=76 /DNA_END=465 /DNA_ORIENTATION=- /assembly_acc=CAM_ASM_000147